MRHKKEIAHCIEGIFGKNARLTYIFFIQYLHFTVRYYTENRINLIKFDLSCSIINS